MAQRHNNAYDLFLFFVAPYQALVYIVVEVTARAIEFISCIMSLLLLCVLQLSWPHRGPLLPRSAMDGRAGPHCQNYLLVALQELHNFWHEHTMILYWFLLGARPIFHKQRDLKYKAVRVS